MSKITVYVPLAPEPDPGSIVKARRDRVDGSTVLTLVENGKPRARDLMMFIADELRSAFPGLEIDIFSKASAGRPLDGDEAKRIAARARLVISGVGD